MAVAGCTRPTWLSQGISPSLSQARRRQADSFLRNTSRSLKYISAQLGFRDQSSFHKAFMRWFNTSPNQYRALQEGRAL